MKTLVQSSLKTAADYLEIDSSEWGTLPKKRVPRGGETIDNVAGWINLVNVQGMKFGGYDHYHVKDIGDGSIRVTIWNDDPEDWAGKEHATVWTIHPLQPDAAEGGAYNTKMSCVRYVTKAQYDFMTRVQLPDGKWGRLRYKNTTFKKWTEFKPPRRHVLHGIWLPDDLLMDHERAMKRHGWREWTAGLPTEEIDPVRGCLRDQRAAGRYIRPDGTITFFQTNTNLAVGGHAADFEKEGNTTNPASTFRLQASIATQSKEAAVVWTSQSGQPNVADWSSGNYRCRVDCFALGADIIYGCLNLNGGANEALDGHLTVLQSDLSTHRENFAQVEPVFTAAGLQTATTGTVDPGAGATSDRFECCISAFNSNHHNAQTIDIDGGLSDNFMDGPFTAPPAATAYYFRKMGQG